MAVSFGASARRHGKVYRVVRADVPPRGSIHAASVTRGSIEGPAVVVAAGEPGVYGLIVPVLRVDQEVTVTVRDAHGRIVEQEGCRIEGRMPSSRGYQPKEMPRALKGLDEHPLPDMAWVTVERLFDNYDGFDVIHGIVEVPVPKGVEDDGFVGVEVLDGLCRPVAPEPFLIVRDDTLPMIDGSSLRRIHYSVRLPHSLGSFMVWARFSNPDLADGFIWMEPAAVQGLRDRWAAIMDSGPMSPLYTPWFDDVRANGRDLAVERGARLSSDPLFSLVVPLFETRLDYFNAMVDSVWAQTWERWELVLVVGSPNQEDLMEAVKELAARDSRVNLVVLPENLGIAGNTLEGIRHATGDYVCFVDHDDLLEPDALFCFAQTVTAEPECDLVYCDEDAWANGRPVNGVLKPAFDLDLLLARNYIGHMLCVSRDALERVDLSRTEDYEGAQALDLALRVSEVARVVTHISRVLYHWRTPADALMRSAQAKPWAALNSLKAVRDYLGRRGIEATVTANPADPSQRTVSYRRAAVPSVSIIVNHTHGRQSLQECLDSLAAHTSYGPTELLVIASDDTLGRVTAPDGWSFRALPESTGNVSARRNLGAAAARGELLLFMDSDCLVEEDGWLETLAGPFAREEVGATGPKMLYPDGLVHSIGICIPKAPPRYTDHLIADSLEGGNGTARLTHGVSALPGSCLMVGRDAFDAVGGFDEDFAHAYGDIDLCLRLREGGWSVVCETHAKVVYSNYALDGRVVAADSYGPGDSPDDLERILAVRREEGNFMRRWYRYLSEGDPFYNPQCAAGHCHYELV